ncbi:MAG: CDGSH iron-sulfur domain-containing protein [Candidatus Thermoplasmatota archaeon]|nr:CDGSH iron-sulfur domain-containing protein [Candidatus Thermoplasmatota archaeon]
MSRIVELHDESPLIIKKDEMEGNVVAVCRCGLSEKWPLCDGSHGHTGDERGRVKYRREDGELVREPADDVDDADPRA